jgi:hypothetical protein
MPGIGELIEGAIQQAPHPLRHVMESVESTAVAVSNLPGSSRALSRVRDAFAAIRRQ